MQMIALMQTMAQSPSIVVHVQDAISHNLFYCWLETRGESKCAARRLLLFRLTCAMVLAGTVGDKGGKTPTIAKSLGILQGFPERTVALFSNYAASDSELPRSTVQLQACRL